jgi:hypothetical protein
MTLLLNIYSYNLYKGCDWIVLRGFMTDNEMKTNELDIMDRRYRELIEIYRGRISEDGVLY